MASSDSLTYLTRRPPTEAEAIPAPLLTLVLWRARCRCEQGWRTDPQGQGRVGEAARSRCDGWYQLIFSGVGPILTLTRNMGACEFGPCLCIVLSNCLLPSHPWMRNGFPCSVIFHFSHHR